MLELHHEPQEGDPAPRWTTTGSGFSTDLLPDRFCHMRNEVRILALDRIKMLPQTKETFGVPEDFSLEAFLGPSFGVYQGEACVGARVPCCPLRHLVFQFRYYRRHHFSHITNNSVIGYLKNFSIRVFVDSNDHF